MELTLVQTQLVALATLACSEYADARLLLRSGDDDADTHFVAASDHALQAGMLAGEHDLVIPDDLACHVALARDASKGLALGYELGHPATLRDA